MSLAVFCASFIINNAPWSTYYNVYGLAFKKDLSTQIFCLSQENQGTQRDGYLTHLLFCSIKVFFQNKVETFPGNVKEPFSNYKIEYGTVA